MNDIKMLYKRVDEKIKEFENIILVPHHRLDGDCLGSCFGYKYVIENLYPNKNVHVIGDHLKNTKFMGEISKLDDDIFNDSLVISLDTGSLDRVIDDRAKAAKNIIRIDHHYQEKIFDDAIFEYVNNVYPSTCTLLTDMFRLNDVEIPLIARECLFFGTVTDTGGFRHRGVNANTHKNAAHLIGSETKEESLIDTQKIFKLIYTKGINALELNKYVLNNYKTTKHGLIYVTLTKDTLIKLDVDMLTIGDYSLNVIEDIEGYPIWAVFYEIEEGIKCSLRSRDNLNVRVVADKFKGGGHNQAAALVVESWKKVDEVIEELNKINKDS